MTLLFVDFFNSLNMEHCLETPLSSIDQLGLLLRVNYHEGLWTVHILSKKEGEQGSLDL